MLSPRQARDYDRAARLHNRAAAGQAAGEPARPERLYLRSLAMKEQLFGPDHLEAGITWNNLGLFYKSRLRFSEARVAYLRALKIFERALGGAHASVADVLYNLSQLARAEADAWERRSQMIQDAAAELADPATYEKAVIRHDLARYRLTAGPSRIHRFGLFAAEAIPADREIIEYTGERVSRRNWAARAASRTYMYRLNNYWCIDGSVGGSGAELINHCCEPNCRFVKQDGRVWVRSLRAIQPGEELLLDYRFSKSLLGVPCYCGAGSCRGTINIS